jgi:hypothetical protein
MGPITASELASVGITTVERLVAMGWEEALVRWVEAYPERLNVNAAAGLLAAEIGVSWLKLTAAEKALAHAKVEGIRMEWGLGPRSRRLTRRRAR